MVDATGESSGAVLRKRLRDGNETSSENGEVLHRGPSALKRYDARKDWILYNRNTDINLLLCQNSAFSESQAMKVLARTPEGIEFICSK